MDERTAFQPAQPRTTPMGQRQAAASGRFQAPRKPEQANDSPADHEHGLVDCVAGFFDTEAQAQAVERQLTSAVGLQPGQCLLLHPRRSRWLHLNRQADAWATGRSAHVWSLAADAPLMALLCGLLASIAALAALVLGEGVRPGVEAVFYLLAPVVAAVAGWTVPNLLPLAPQYRHFSDKVHAELDKGRWVVLTHQTLWSQQTSVLELMRSRAVSWCTVSPSRGML